MEKNKIKYLSFEGGGGKGNAFLGAIGALEVLEILKKNNVSFLMYNQILGLSGASAGAITAFLISLGYSSKDIYEIFTETNFDEFFDEPVEGEKLFGNQFKQTANTSDLPHGVFMEILEKVDYINLKFFQIILNKKLKELDKSESQLVLKLLKKLSLYLSCLKYDFGLFSGKKLKSFFDNCLKKKLIEKKIDCLPENYTFEQHYVDFGVKLALTGTNFSTENSHFFSHKTTPLVPITTAVRLSMSLPFIYKPVIFDSNVIKKFQLDKSYEGYYLDGGLFNNAPVRTFEDQKDSETILFRLGNREQKNKFDYFISDYLFNYLKMSLMGNSGSGQVTMSTFNFNNIIQLDITGTDLLKFNMNKEELLKLSNHNFSNICRIFEPNKKFKLPFGKI